MDGILLYIIGAILCLVVVSGRRSSAFPTNPAYNTFNILSLPPTPPSLLLSLPQEAAVEGGGGTSDWYLVGGSWREASRTKGSLIGVMMVFWLCCDGWWCLSVEATIFLVHVEFVSTWMLGKWTKKSKTEPKSRYLPGGGVIPCNFFSTRLFW